MTTVRVNGVHLRYEAAGSGGSPVVFVHGSWGDHHNWDLVAPEVAHSNRVLTYDRRGHSESERPDGQGSVHDDVADLAALIEALDLAPTHVVGNSFGAIISLRLAAARPELIRTLFVHEPPLFPLLAGNPEMAPILEAVRQRIGGVVQRLQDGDMSGGARQFVEEVALGPGAWAQLPPQVQQTFITNAPTVLDESLDPDALNFDLSTLSGFDRPTLISQGDQSPPMFGPIVELVAKALPGASRHTFHGAGHVPHMTHPADYLETLSSFTRET